MPYSDFLSKCGKTLARFGWTTSASILIPILAMALLAPVNASETVTYEYDALGRLVTVSRDDGTDTDVVDYEYDDAGNRTKRTVTAGGGGGGNPPNNPPVAVDDAVGALQLFVPVYAQVTSNDSDPDGDPITITSVPQQPSNGIVTIDSATTLRILPTQGGTDTFDYVISDGNGLTDSATVTFSAPSGGGPPR